MDTDDMRESGDDLADLDDPEDDVENSVNDSKETESTSSENRQENQASTSQKSSKRNKIKTRPATPKIPRIDPPTNPSSIKRSWRSANAFVNFVQDFKKGNPETMMGRNIFQICSERWKSMSDEQKQPYIAAANTVKRLKQRKIGEGSEQQSSKKSMNRVSKRKAETKRKETYQKRSKVINPGYSDTDTATTTKQSSVSDAEFF